MRKGLVIFIVIILTGSYHLTMCQNYGNEWINYSQQYFRINIISDGLYRIDKNTLIKSGIPVNNFDPRSIQIFGRGVEQYIYVQGENDGKFDNDDYIEFYAKRNDGWLDEKLYKKPDFQANPNYSLINDSATYYLSWNSSVNNKRMKLETDINFSSYTPAKFYYKTIRQDYTDYYYLGATNQNGSTEPEYTAGEGWFDKAFTLDYGSTSVTKSLSTTNIYNQGPEAQIDFTLIGASDFAFLYPDHHIQVQYCGKVLDTLLEAYYLSKFQTKVSPLKLTSGNTDFYFQTINNLNSGADRNTIAYISIKYPHTFSLDNTTQHTLFIPDNTTQPKSLLNFSNFIIGNTDTARLYDISNNKRITVLKNNEIYSALLPNSGNEKECFLTSDNNIHYVNSLNPVNKDISNFAKFINYKSFNNAASDYIIITHQSLMSEALNYQSYRNSTGFKTLLADVDQLYDQFSYGIRKHPLAIKNFIKYAVNNFVSKPQYVFLIGKAYKAGQESRSSDVFYRKNEKYYKLTLVPSFGQPPSDILFSSQLNDTLITPIVPIGRLSAKDPGEVSIYLNKVRQYEAAQLKPEEWQKNVLHFGGGTSSTQQKEFASYLNNYKRMISDTSFGGFVGTFLKTSSAPIEVNESDSLKVIINNGVSLLTFFGHAAGIGFDVSIDHPSEYSNYGKYPFLLANSCWSGDIFTEEKNSSESFVIIENKGMIGFLASITTVSSTPLNVYSNELYKNISSVNYGKSIGKCIQNTIKNIQTFDIDIKNACLLTTLHCDPAIIINSHLKPDYILNPSNIFFKPTIITTQADSFNVNIIPTNIGKAINKTFSIEIKRTFPDGTSKATYYKKCKAPYYKDTVSIKLPVDIKKGIGLNTLLISLDSYNEIDEISEINNSASISFMIKSPDITPVYPYNHSIIPSKNLTLKASTNDPFMTPLNYIFELDTNDNFVKPILSKQINSKGGLVCCTYNIPLKDSTVYFWRVSIDPAVTGKYVWKMSSFQYIEGRKGWAQANIKQFKDNTFQYININSQTRTFDFAANITGLFVQTGYYPYIAWTEEYFKINNTVAGGWSCTGDVGDGMKFVIFNPISGATWMSYPQGNGLGQFGNLHCQTYPTAGIDFSTSNTAWMQAMTKLLDSVPNGYWVLAFSHRNHNAENYTPELLKAFENIGSASIRKIKNYNPYIIFGKKGDPIGSAHEVIGNSPQSIITIKDSIRTKWNEGTIESEQIGPSSKWHSFHWKQHSLEKINKDTIRLKIIGIKKDGTNVTIKNNLPPDTANIYNLEKIIDANTYPYIKLTAYTKDNFMNTPSQINRWQVIYDGIAEVALDPSSYYKFHKDTLQQGDNLLFASAIKNAGDYNTDSLTVKYWIIDNKRQLHLIPHKKTTPIKTGTFIKDSISLSSMNYIGRNSLWIEVNPDNIFPEQYHFNNVGQLYFYVKSDKTNPLLDVTFDGIHILNGDIVSAYPDILITLKDENKYLPLTDTSSLNVFLTQPGNSSPKPIYFNNKKTKEITSVEDNLIFYPASLPDNTCKIEYKRRFPIDGTYKLSVQAKDITGNKAGSNNFEIEFKIINKSMISELMNWPNPFSTATHFVFILTGSEIPTEMRIQIMTITGKIVREIFQNELGPIHIGRNITEFTWDGKDQFGDRLANGIYLYRVTTDLKGKSIEKYNTEADKYFTKEFGKMYLIK